MSETFPMKPLLQMRHTGGPAMTGSIAGKERLNSGGWPALLPYAYPPFSTNFVGNALDNLQLTQRRNALQAGMLVSLFYKLRSRKLY